MTYKEPVLAALERLEQVGVNEKDVTLVCVVISKDAAETLTEEAGEMNVVSDDKKKSVPKFQRAK